MKLSQERKVCIAAMIFMIMGLMFCWAKTASARGGRLSGDFLELQEQATPGVSPAGFDRLWADTATHKLKASINNGAFVVVPTVGGGDIDLGSSTVTGTATIARGGTNSATALSGSTIVVSNGSAIVQGSAGTTSTVLHGNAAGLPTYGQVALATEVSGLLPFANFTNGSAISVTGRSANSTGVQASIAATDNGDILTPVAGTLGFNKIASVSAVQPTLVSGGILGYEPSTNARYNVYALGGLFNNGVAQGRLTLTSGTPVTTSDVTGAGTIYYTPYNGNRIALFDGTNWRLCSFTEVSLALSGLNPGGIYDVFAYDSGSGTVALETLQWTETSGTLGATSTQVAPDRVITSAAHGMSVGDRVWLYGIGTADTGLNNRAWVITTVTTGTTFITGGFTFVGGGTNGSWRKLNVARSTALVLQDGVYVKTGVTTRRYLGTFLATAAGTTEDSAQRRYLWNAYNRVSRKLLRSESTDSWTYTTAAYRCANGTASNSVEVVIGLVGQAESLTVGCIHSNSTIDISAAIGIGIDSTTTNSADITGFCKNASTTAVSQPRAFLNYSHGTVGQHVYTWLEQSTATGTATWYGDAGTPTTVQSGITGHAEN